MALRVLLADESTTIKKVMQLALQDFAVEVKSVQAGVDVLEVARSFNPDIVFADVLLQKRNGYEVCAELKDDPALKTLPVVLMWSSFMDLDEKAFASCRADGKLEKPFDVDALRALVTGLVHKTKEQKLSSHLRFPSAMTDPMHAEAQAARAAPSAQKSRLEAPPKKAVAESDLPVPRAPADSAWSMESFADPTDFATRSTLAPVPPPLEDENESFAQVKLGGKTAAKPDDDSEPWSHQDLSRFKVDLPSVEVESEDISLAVNFQDVPADDSFLLRSEKRPLGSQASLAKAAKEPEEIPSFELSEIESSGLLADAGPKLATAEERAYAKRAENTAADFTEFHTFEMDAASDLELTLSVDPADLKETAKGQEPPDVAPFKIEAPETAAGFSSPYTKRPPAESASRAIAPAASVPTPDSPKPAQAQLSADQLEAIIRSQSQEIIQAAVQRLVPELANKLIRQELERLLAETPGGKS